MVCCIGLCHVAGVSHSPCACSIIGQGKEAGGFRGAPSDCHQQTLPRLQRDQTCRVLWQVSAVEVWNTVLEAHFECESSMICVLDVGYVVTVVYEAVASWVATLEHADGG